MTGLSRKFLHQLQKVDGGYLVGDRVWEGFAFSTLDKLYLNTELGKLSVERTYQGEGFAWDFTRELSTNVRFHGAGTLNTIEEACTAAIQYSPEIITLEYLGTIFVGYGAPRQNGTTLWTMSVDDNLVQVFGPLEKTPDGQYFKWTRLWAPAAELLEHFCNFSGCLEGRAPTLQAAFIAAVDAPELFKRACGKMIASLQTA